MNTEFDQAFGKMINNALDMVAPLSGLAESAENVTVTVSARLNPIVRQWRREQNRRHLQAYLHTRRTSRRK